MGSTALTIAIMKMLALAGVGIALRATKLLKREHAKVLNSLIIYAALPALVFRVARQTDLSWDLARVAGIAWVVGGVGFAVAWGIARLLRLPKRTAAAFILVTALGNTGYIGYPVTTMLLGAKSLPQAVFYDVFGTVALLFTVGIMIAGRMGKHEGPISVVKELLTAPALVALMAGLASRLVPVSGSVETSVMDWLGILANMTVPLVMISLGLTLTAKGFKGRLAVLGVTGAVKLLLLPIVAALAAVALGETSGMRLVMLQAGMPSMMLTLVISERFGLDTDFTASAILATTMACVVTVPLVQMLLG
ncbi:MAG: AEC family transporter [Coriobacteriia bacterium]|nr:AEC family transporter [Coriobacteriia bacterium]